MSENISEEKTLDKVETVAEEVGLELDYINTHYDSVNQRHVIRFWKYVENEGGREKFGTEISLSEREILDDTLDVEEYVERRAEEALRTIREELSKEVEVNGHELQFYMEDGFEAVDHRTGEEWSIQPEDCKHTALPTSPVDGGTPQCVYSHPREEREIPHHIKEKMMMWVVGWAVEHSPDEWRSKLVTRGYNRNI